MPGVSDRTLNLGTENAFVVLEEVNKRLHKGEKIISFCVGQPDFDSPEPVKNAARKALDEGKTGYADCRGIRELREAVAEYEGKKRGITIDPEWVVVDAGAKPFITHSIMSSTDYGKGEEIMMPNPGYPIYKAQAIVHGTKPVAYNLLESKNFDFDLEDFKEKVSDKTKLIIINSPQNPTGGVLPKDSLKGIADIALEKDLWVFADEIYQNILFEGEFSSIASIDGMQEKTIISTGVSKTFAMTGWRIGYAINEKLSRHFRTWAINTTAGAAHPNQYAAVAALKESQKEADKMTASFHRRRDLIVKLLNEIPGFKCLSPKGTFYAYPNVTKACELTGIKDSEEFRKKLLDEAKVAVLSDIHFGTKIQGEGEHIRFSFATSDENIKNGTERIKEFMEKNSK
ncbi:pyridoxal phosphate-dependent aminotransferase [Candidatus Micrarchaeota archaeon]|nr:pyridoxal phosphate-dependent aminotransferase [Candidatus Micrarchaeota archaeon]MBU2476646.1 pyridoxal phosphate-dependent aminotransferase [Candidatus Micrarchaeota archaeon]